MAKRTYGHRLVNGKAVTAEQGLPQHLRGYDPEFDVHTVKEGPLRRLFGRRR